MKDAMQTGFSFVQIGEFSFIIAGLGNSLGVLNPVLYPIIVASSVVTTFLTPYIMKAAVPCYNALYKRAPERLRAKIDAREQQVLTTSDVQEKGNLGDKVQHAVRHTVITKRVVKLFIENMSANDKPHDDQQTNND